MAFSYVSSRFPCKVLFFSVYFLWPTHSVQHQLLSSKAFSKYCYHLLFTCLKNLIIRSSKFIKFSIYITIEFASECCIDAKLENKRKQLTIKPLKRKLAKYTQLRLKSFNKNISLGNIRNNIQE